MVSPLLILQARAEARAILFANGEFADIEQAMAPLRTYAVESGIADTFGAAAVVALINTAFGIKEAPGDGR